MLEQWAVEIDLRPDWVDYLGHITAAAHLAICEEARTLWLRMIMETDQPSFVLAHQELDYRRELLMPLGRVVVTVRPVELGHRSVSLYEEIRSGDGLHTESSAVLVRWDRENRRSMAFPALERERIAAQMPASPE